MDEMPRVSNGAKALHIASEHWARVEQELDETAAKLEEREQNLATALGRIAEQSELINRVEQERNAWMLKAAQLAQTVINVATMMVEGGREAQDIIGTIRHGEVEQAAGAAARLQEIFGKYGIEELRTNGGG